jgi:mercuric ion transport protein
MNDRALVRTGAIGAGVAALCCATPVLAVVLPAFGLGAWLTGADYVLVPLLLAGLGLVALGLYRRRAAATACCATETSNQDRSL